MVNSVASFISIFNFGILNTKRRLLVQNTHINRSLLALLRENGYVLNYGILNNNHIEVYQNFALFPFKLKIFRKATTRFISHHQLKTFSNSGRVFVLSTGRGYMFSNLALIYGIGGTVIFEVKFFY